MKTDDWNQHRLLITHSLDRLEAKVDIVLEKQQKLEKDLEVHKVKSGFWGAFMGGVMALVARIVGGH